LSAGTAFSASHPGYAAISVVKGFQNLMESVGIKQSADAISNQDIVKWMSSLVTKTDDKGNPLLTPDIYTNIVLGKWDKVLTSIKTVLTRVTGETTGKGLRDAFGS
jgi:hypothetical protein